MKNANVRTIVATLNRKVTGFKVVGIEVKTARDGRAITYVECASAREPSRTYKVDITRRRCACPGFIYHKDAEGNRIPCKHLNALSPRAVVNAAR